MKQGSSEFVVGTNQSATLYAFEKESKKLSLRTIHHLKYLKMKKFISFSPVVLFFCLPVFAISQQTSQPSMVTEINGMSNYFPMKISDAEYLYAFKKSGDALATEFFKFDTSLQVLWRKNLPVGTIDYAKSGDKLVIFSSSQWTGDWSQIKTLHVTSVEIKDGITVQDKDLLTTDDKLFMVPLVLKDSLNDFKGVLLRYATSKQKDELPTAVSQRIEWILLDDNLDVKTHVTLNNDFTNSIFLTSYTTAKGDLITYNIAQNKLTADKYSEGKPDKVGSLSATLSQSTDLMVRSYSLSVSPDEKNSLCTVSFTPDEKLFNVVVTKFDFLQNKADAFVTDQKDKHDFSKKNYGVPYTILPLDVEFYKNGFVKVEQLVTRSHLVHMMSSSIEYNLGDVIVSFFDEKMRETGHLTITDARPSFFRDRYPQHNVNIRTHPGIKIIGNKMVISAGARDNVLDENPFNKKKFVLERNLRYVVADLDSANIIKDTTIALDTKLHPVGYYFSGLDAWMNNTALLYHIWRDPLIKNVSIILEKIPFNF